MKFFIDSANINHIKEAASLGLLDGVTTNPSLVAKEGKNFIEILNEIVKIVDGPISAEVVSTDYAGIIKEAEDLVKIHKNIVVKVPLIREGIKAVKAVPVNLRGEKAGNEIKISGNSFEIEIGAYKPATFLIEI